MTELLTMVIVAAIVALVTVGGIWLIKKSGAKAFELTLEVLTFIDSEFDTYSKIFGTNEKFNVTFKHWTDILIEAVTYIQCTTYVGADRTTDAYNYILALLSHEFIPNIKDIRKSMEDNSVTVKYLLDVIFEMFDKAGLTPEKIDVKTVKRIYKNSTKIL